MNAQGRPFKSKLKSVLCFLIIIFSITILNAQTPVAVHGQLSIVGNRLKDKNGNNYQLRGMSMFWSNWQGKFWNYETIKWLRDDWNCNVVRAAMGISPDDNSGYLGNPDIERQKMITVIEAAIDLGIYVVVDWHSHKAENETAEAKAFFSEIAQKYGSYPNIIYETYNEPVTSWSVIKTYHNAVVSEIRKYDTKNTIILGTPFYSQNIDEATNSPLTGSNLSYALHYYAASHTFWNSVGTVSGKGYYVFVSEFGTCDASGAGSVDAGNSNTWWNTLDQYGVSWCNWAVSDVNEAAAIVKPGSSPKGGWNPTTDLTPSGVLVRNKLRGYAKDPIPTNIAPYITSSPKSQSVPFQSSATFSVEVSGPTPFTYKWYFKGNLLANSNTASYTIASVTPQDTGSYYVEITNSIGSTKSKTATLNIRYRSPYYSTSQSIPGVIQFEDYDKDGQDIGYSDASYGNSGGGYRKDDVDIEPITGQAGEYSIGFTDNGEWLSYSVNVGWDGEYTSDVYYASLPGGGAYSMYIDDKPIVAKTTIPTSGGWFTYAKASAIFNLTKGEHILKFKIDVSGFNIDFMEFKSKTAPQTAPIITAQPKSTNAKVGKAASIFVSATGAATLAYQWYFKGKAITGATLSSYSVTAVAQSDSGDYYVIVTNPLGTITSNTATISVQNTSAYLGIPTIIPGRLMCKNWDEGGQNSGFYDSDPTENKGVTNSGATNSYRENAVDVETCTDGGTGFSVGYITAGEWLEYSVIVKYSGTYTIGFRVASGSTTGVMALGINVDGMTLINTLSVPNTGAWSTWKTVTQSVTLTAGTHIIRLKANQGDFNINYIDFTLVSATAEITLNNGWNLFALPLTPADSSISKVFTGITGLEVKSQDQFYSASQLAIFNSLSKLTTGKGYLIYNGGTQTKITITGTAPKTSINTSTLVSGWNLVGNSSDAIKTNTLGTSIQVIKDFDSFYIPGNTSSTLNTLGSGKAYFIKK